MINLIQTLPDCGLTHSSLTESGENLAMDQQARIQSEKDRLEDNKRRLSLLNPRENHENTQEKPETSSNTRFDFIFKIVIIGDAVRANRLETSQLRLNFVFRPAGRRP